MRGQFPAPNRAPVVRGRILAQKQEQMPVQKQERRRVQIPAQRQAQIPALKRVLCLLGVHVAVDLPSDKGSFDRRLGVGRGIAGSWSALPAIGFCVELASAPCPGGSAVPTAGTCRKKTLSAKSISLAMSIISL